MRESRIFELTEREVHQAIDDYIKKHYYKDFASFAPTPHLFHWKKERGTEDDILVGAEYEWRGD